MPTTHSRGPQDSPGRTIIDRKIDKRENRPCDESFRENSAFSEERNGLEGGLRNVSPSHRLLEPYDVDCAWILWI